MNTSDVQAVSGLNPHNPALPGSALVPWERDVQSPVLASDHAILQISGFVVLCAHTRLPMWGSRPRSPFTSSVFGCALP